MNKDTHEMLSRLERAGITPDDALSLRRISVTLHRWHEMECGVEGGWYIERETDDEDSTPHLKNGDTGKDYGRTLDREKGAKKRLDAIMARYPHFLAYIQGDPRGASLYIIRKDALSAGEDVDAYYSSRGIAIHK